MNQGGARGEELVALIEAHDHARFRAPLASLDLRAERFADGSCVRLAGPGLAPCYVGLIAPAAFEDLVAARTPAGRAFLEALQCDLVDALRFAQRPLARFSFG